VKKSDSSDSSDSNSQELDYKKYNSSSNHTDTKKRNAASSTSTQPKDIFDSAPFVKPDENRVDTKNIETDNKPNAPIVRKNARKAKQLPKPQSNTRDKPYNPFEDNFSANQDDFRQKADSDPFKMAPMKATRSKVQNNQNHSAPMKEAIRTKPHVSKKHVKSKPLNDPFQETSSKHTHTTEDPFGSAPFVKANPKNTRNVPSSELQVKVKPRKKRMLPEVPSVPMSNQQTRIATTTYY